LHGHYAPSCNFHAKPHGHGITGQANVSLTPSAREEKEKTNMKLFNPLTIIFLLISSMSIYSKEYKIGDTLKDAVQNIQIADLYSTEDLGLWLENKISIYKNNDGNLVLFSMNYYPFGIITKSGNENVFLLDFNGDSVLDCQPEMLFVPPWVIDLNSKGGDSGDIIRKLYVEKLLAYSGNTTPSESPHMIKFAQELVKIAQNNNLDDRIYIYFDYLHDLLYKRKEYLIDKACLANIEAITGKTNEARSVWLIQAIELAYKDNDIDLCRKYDQEIVKINNKFVPGLYYQYLLEKNEENKNKYKKQLVENFKDHWLVQDRFYQ
jgi:hypothetical protein